MFPGTFTLYSPPYIKVAFRLHLAECRKHQAASASGHIGLTLYSDKKDLPDIAIDVSLDLHVHKHAQDDDQRDAAQCHSIP